MGTTLDRKPASHIAMNATCSAACIRDSPLQVSSMRSSRFTVRALLGLLRSTVEGQALTIFLITTDNGVTRVFGSLQLLRHYHGLRLELSA
jgi:hypothetical protein